MKNTAQMADMTYLFLDFDGVLHPMFPGRAHKPWEHDPFCYLDEFEGAVRKIPGQFRIVISSTWRRGRTLEQLRVPFSADIAPLIVGATPMIGSGMGEGGRAREVMDWLDTHAPGARAVAIDDMPQLYLSQETKSIAVVCCPDRFGRQQARDLVQACQNPEAWATNNPVIPQEGKIIIPSNHFRT